MKKILTLFAALLLFGQAWGDAAAGYTTVTETNQTLTISGSTLNNLTRDTLNYNQGKFSISLSNISSYNRDGYLELSTLAKNKTSEHNFNWSLDSKYSAIKVSRIDISMKSYLVAGTVSLNNGEATSVYTMSTDANGQTNISSNNALGLAQPINVKCKGGGNLSSATFRLYSIKFTYDISHQELDFRALNDAIDDATEKYDALADADKNTTEGQALNNAIQTASTFITDNSGLKYKTTGKTPSDVEVQINALTTAVSAIQTVDDVKADIDNAITDINSLNMSDLLFVSTAISNATTARDNEHTVSALSTALSNLKEAYFKAQGMTHLYNVLKTIINQAAAVGYNEPSALYENANSNDDLKTAIGNIRTNAIAAARNAYLSNGNNMTIFVVNNSFELGDATGWNIASTVEDGDGAVTSSSSDNKVCQNAGGYASSPADGNYLWNTKEEANLKALTSNTGFNPGQSISQNITGLPNGNYKVSVYVSSDNGKKVNLIVNGNTTSVDATGAANLVQLESEQVSVTDGNLSITIRGGESTVKAGAYTRKYGVWYRADNITLKLLNQSRPAIVRTELNEGDMSTICLPDYGDATGATFYQIAGKRLNNSNEVTSIVFEEVDNLVGGTPYIFIADGTSDVTINQGNGVAVAGSANGLHGVYEDTPFSGLVADNAATSDYYVVLADHIQAANGQGGVYANRAYIKMSEVPVYEPSATAGRRIVEVQMEGAGENTATSIEDTNATDQAVKFIENGKVLILRDGVVYDVMGRIIR